MNMLLPTTSFLTFTSAFLQIIPTDCVLMSSSPFLTPCCLPPNFQQEKYVHVFTVPTLLVLLKLVACMHAQTHTSTHWGALKWKRPQALYLPYIIHPPQHKQHRMDTHSKKHTKRERRGEERRGEERRGWKGVICSNEAALNKMLI